MGKNFGEKDIHEQSKTDRRVRKTKAQLLQSLMTLMQEKDIKDISVKELSDLADINRGTFYLHYRDVYDMLSQVEDTIFQEFNEILDKNFAPDSEAALYSVLEDNFHLSGRQPPDRPHAARPAWRSHLCQPHEGTGETQASAPSGCGHAGFSGF